MVNLGIDRSTIVRCRIVVQHRLAPAGPHILRILSCRLILRSRILLLKADRKSAFPGLKLLGQIQLQLLRLYAILNIECNVKEPKLRKYRSENQGQYNAREVPSLVQWSPSDNQTAGPHPHDEGGEHNECDTKAHGEETPIEPESEEKGL